MPYIKEEERQALLSGEEAPRTPGELNFLLTVLAGAYLEEHGESYQTYNDIMGALEGCKLELYRRMIAPYEDVKIAENGDVFV